MTTRDDTQHESALRAEVRTEIEKAAAAHAVRAARGVDDLAAAFAATLAGRRCAARVQHATLLDVSTQLGEAMDNLHDALAHRDVTDRVGFELAPAPERSAAQLAARLQLGRCVWLLERIRARLDAATDDAPPEPQETPR